MPALLLWLVLCLPASACLNDSAVGPSEASMVKTYNSTAGLVGLLLLYQRRR